MDSDSVPRFVQSRDQDFAGIRDSYNRLLDEEKAEVRKWLETAKELKWPFAMGQFKFHIEIDRGPEGEIVVTDPRSLLRAIDAWDSGEVFAPKGRFGF